MFHLKGSESSEAGRQATANLTGAIVGTLGLLIALSMMLTARCTVVLSWWMYTIEHATVALLG